MNTTTAQAPKQAPAIRHNTAPSYTEMVSLVAMLARLKTNDEIPGGMLTQDAVANLDQLIVRARRILKYQQRERRRESCGGTDQGCAADDAAPGLLRSALVALKDLDAGYPWSELHTDLDTLLAKAARIGVDVADD